MRKNKLKKLSKKTIFAFIVCAITFSILGVGAASVLYSSDVTYDNSSSGLSSTTVQDALDELYEQTRNAPKCDSTGNCTTTCERIIVTGTTFICQDSNNVYYKAALGDYISMTPNKTSYSTNSSYVGGSDYVTTINPSELNLWRIINKKSDGTVDMISEYVSSKTVIFYGSDGYKNLIGQLNLLASAYENSAYTSGSRYFGYANQTKFCSSYGTSVCNGDSDYVTDQNYLSNAGVSLTAYSVNYKSTETSYWVASRHYECCYYWYGAYYGNGSIQYSFLTYENSGTNNRIASHALRPIVTLKPTVKVSGGSGTKSNPYTLSAS